MFNYIEANHNKIDILLPHKLSFDFEFLSSMSHLVHLSNIDTVEILTISCSVYARYDKMCKAYLCNVLEHLKRKGLKVFVNNPFQEIVMGCVERQQGQIYESETDISKIITNNSLQYYCFECEENTDKPVKTIVEILSDKLLTIDTKQLKGFLTTTIGEIFSNSNNHSDQQEVFFMCSVESEEGKYYLYVNIIDYGATIVSNVRKHFKDDEKSPKECMSWAIQQGNTTRKGSGGYGLDMLIKYIEAVEGDLLIFSGNACFVVQSDGNKIIEDSDKQLFSGTSVTFKVRLFDASKVITVENGIVSSISLDSV